MRISRWAVAALGLVTAVLLVGCGGGSSSESAHTTRSPVHRAPKKLKSFAMTLEGYPDAENVGVLMAAQRGYFAEAGLDVEVLFPVDSNNVPGYVNGEFDLVGLLPQPQVVMAKEEGMSLVAVGGLVRERTMALISSPGSEIQELADLKGKTIAINGFSFEEGLIEALLARAGLMRDDITIKVVSYGLVPALISGRVDAILGSGNIEGVELEARGLSPVVTPLQGLGIPSFEELVVVTRRSQLSGKPRWIGRFMSAVSRGAAAAIENPAAAAEAIVVAREGMAVAPTTQKVSEAKVEATLPLLSEDAEMSREKAARLSEWMHEQGLIRKELPAPAVLTNRFVQPAS